MHNPPISSFSLPGTDKGSNQDQLLVHNAAISASALSQSPSEDPDAAIQQPGYLGFFVADGVGGHGDGAFAANFVIDALRQRLPKTEPNQETLTHLLQQINSDLLAVCTVDAACANSATTLVGAILSSDKLLCVSVGDSEALLFRDGALVELILPQAIDLLDRNSPIVSYFGGQQDRMDPCFATLHAPFEPSDVAIFCSDGLQKALPKRRLIAILDNNRTFQQRTSFIERLVTENHRPDDATAIFIELFEAVPTEATADLPAPQDPTQNDDHGGKIP